MEEEESSEMSAPSWWSDEDRDCWVVSGVCVRGRESTPSWPLLREQEWRVWNEPSGQPAAASLLRGPLASYDLTPTAPVHCAWWGMRVCEDEASQTSGSWK